MRPLIYLALLAIVGHAHSARILGLFPHTGKSHQMVFEPLLKKLAQRGHHLTVVSFFPLKNPPANYTDVSLEGIANLGLETFDLGVYETSSVWMKTPILSGLYRQLVEFHPLAAMALNTCGKAVSWPPLIQALRREYDLVLVENFNSDCMLGLLHVYGINVPKVALLSSNLMPWSAPRVGITDNPAYVQTVTTAMIPPFTFLERLENTWLNLFYKAWFRYEVQNKERAIIERYYKRQIPDLEDLARNTSMLLMNTFHGLQGPKPSVPGLVEVGGMHLDHSLKPLPRYMEKFLNESDHGVVLFSFGSLIKTASMPKYKEEIFINVLSKLKQRVLWKFEESAEEGTMISDNIMRVRWIPQFDLLRHHKVVAFLAHGGLLGVTEAISAGKPMVIVPFFGDQPGNGAVAQAAGMAKVVSYDTLNEKDLSEALQSVLSADMRMNARRVSRLWTDRQADPLDTAVYWTERVLRWGHTAPLHTAARDLAFYELALLDVAAASLLGALCIIAIFWYTISLISRLFTKQKEKIH